MVKFLSLVWSLVQTIVITINAQSHARRFATESLVNTLVKRNSNVVTIASAYAVRNAHQSAELKTVQSITNRLFKFGLGMKRTQMQNL